MPKPKLDPLTIPYMALGFAAAWREAFDRGDDLPPQMEAMFNLLDFAAMVDAEACDECLHAYDIAEPFGEKCGRALLIGYVSCEDARAMLKEIHSH